MKKIVISLSVIAVGILLSGVVFAQTATTLEQKKQSINRCDIIGKNVDKRISNFDKSKAKHVEQYQKMYNRITALVTKLEGEGYDVAQLKIDLIQLDTLIKKFSSDYAVYIAGLRDTKEFTCGRSEGEFKAKLGIARAQLKVVHDDSVAIRTFWAKTIKPEIEALKTQVKTTTVEGGTQ